MYIENNLTKELKMNNSDKKMTEKFIEDINTLIARYQGIEAVETERDDLCNVRWILENKLNEVIVVRKGENFWLASGNKC